MRASRATCILVLVSSLACGSGRTADEADREWSFIDTKSGGFATLSESLLVMAESGIAVRSCPRDSAMRCFSSDVFSFAIPRDAASRTSWEHEGRMYCVIRRFEDPHDSGREESAWLIYSSVRDTCGGSKPFDQFAVYSRRAGLRLLHQSSDAGGFNELWAVDTRGFAAGWVR
jgi:hypothetical protein